MGPWTGYGPQVALCCVVAAIAACESGTAPPTGSEPEKVAFAVPILGVPMVDVFYGAYQDHGAGSAPMDYACGLKAYGGHRGVDVLLRNFQVQDSGVAVVAAAPGTVTAVVDGHPDRNTSWAAGGGFGNHVVVLHGGGIQTVYAHLRRHSIEVDPGDPVDAGTILGLVGSSGRSNWPHLHFEVQDGTVAVDPFAGACGPGQSMWEEQLAYQNEFMVADAGITDVDPLTLASLLERPPSTATVPLDTHSTGFWIQLVNQPAAAVRIEVHGPDGGAPAHVTNGSVAATFSMRYLAISIPVQGVLTRQGTWEVRTFQDDALIWTTSFDVTGAAGAHAAVPADGADPRPDPRLMVLDQAPLR